MGQERQEAEVTGRLSRCGTQPAFATCRSTAASYISRLRASYIRQWLGRLVPCVPCKERKSKEEAWGDTE